MEEPKFLLSSDGWLEFAREAARVIALVRAGLVANGAAAISDPP